MVNKREKQPRLETISLRNTSSSPQGLGAALVSVAAVPVGAAPVAGAF